MLSQTHRYDNLILFELLLALPTFVLKRHLFSLEGLQLRHKKILAAAVIPEVAAAIIHSSQLVFFLLLLAAVGLLIRLVFILRVFFDRAHSVHSKGQVLLAGHGRVSV